MEDYSELGLRVGIEIHCQLNARHKLFCNCPAELATGAPDHSFLRRLRPTQSELGEVDPAALFEFQKGRVIKYEADSGNACLVEADEEPPHSLNEEAVNIALTVARMLKASPVDAIHVMRKSVIDGSNTTGFQRTAAVALNGSVTIGSKEIPIQHISLEEDAARKTGEEGLTVRYRIDRLCIPLVEIATGPVLYSPEEAQNVAAAIGRILKTTRKMKRGIGTIRQDLNISLSKGALVEIKGVQKLELISKAVESEVQRQTALLEIREELTKRGAREEEVRPEFHNLTEVFKGTKSKVIEKGLNKGGVVLGVKLPKFKGLLGRELIPNVRLGTELSWHAMLYGGVGGIFHSDELPGYGIAQNELEEIRRLLAMRDLDAAVLVCDIAQKAEDALKAVVRRAKVALTGVPEETRAALEDGTSRYMRPRPGAARMYPETDIPPFVVSEGRVKAVEENLPEMPESLTKKIMEQYGVNHKLATQLLDSDYLTLFEEAASTTQIAPSFIATILTETLKSLERRKVPVDDLTEGQLQEVFRLVDSKTTAKESAEAVIEWLCAHKGRSAGEALTALNLKMVSVEELEKRIDAIIKQNQALIREMGDKAVGKLIGIAMGDFRGRAEAGEVMRIVKEKLRAR